MYSPEWNLVPLQHSYSTATADVFLLHFSNTAQLLNKSCTAITQRFTAVNYSINTAVFNEVKIGHNCDILIKFVSKTPFLV